MKVMKGRGSLTASGEGVDVPRLRPRLVRPGASGAMASAVASAMASATGSSTFRVVRRLARSASRTATRLFGPRTGVRGVKIHPTPGTGLPPISRPSSKSHLYSPWNSWNESLDSTTAPVRSAMRSRNPSPRPMAPAGGDTISPASSASSRIWRSDSSMR
jgi:hypothetical protein